MASKTLSVTTDVYDLLSREKFLHESFSEVIRRLVKTRGKLSDCAGLWADMSDKEELELLNAIKELRESGTKSMMKRVKNI